MANRETLEQFAKNLSKFSPTIVKRIVKDWNEYTVEVHAESQSRVPILSGDLLRSGTFKQAKITAQGIESYIVYNLPYAKVIEEGVRDGKIISLKPQGYVYPDGQTKEREGRFSYLGTAVKNQLPDTITAIKRSISKAWELI